MVFSSLIFLLFFMPLTVLVSCILPGRLKNPFLFIASLFFYAWGEPIYVTLMLGSITVHYFAARLIENYPRKDAKRLIASAIPIGVSIIVFILFKYLGGILGLSLPIGISFYTFQIISYTIDVYRGKIEAEKNFITLGTYISLFPQLIAGPIVRFTDVRGSLHNRVITGNDLYFGLRYFVFGLFKKVVFANQVGKLWQEISGNITEATLITAWIGGLAFTMQIYFDFSGYSDMAIGLGRMLGFSFPENFRYPYVSKSITEFWRRWHITLSSWFRDYIYIPLGGSRRGNVRQIVNLFIVWSLTGIWHGAGFNFLLWGVYYFVFLVLEKFILKGILERLPGIVSHIYTLVIVIFGWMIFESEGIYVFKNTMASLLGAHGIIDSMSFYYIRTNWFMLLIMTMASMGAFKGIFGFYSENENNYSGKRIFAGGILIIGGIFVSIAYLTGDSYNPFLYFRF